MEADMLTKLGTSWIDPDCIAAIEWHQSGSTVIVGGQRIYIAGMSPDELVERLGLTDEDEDIEPTDVALDNPNAFDILRDL